MKKCILAFLCVLCSLGASAQFSGSGTGTQSDPYLIFNPIQLNQIRGFLNQSGVYFKLMSDIDLTEWIADNNPSQGWQPIGTDASPFKGIFDGGNHTISGLMINRGTTNYVGIFANVSGATIQNITIRGTVSGKERVGGLVGYASGSSFNQCVYEGSITATNYAGGIVGYATGTTTLKNSCVKIKIIASGNNVGGIAGYGESGSSIVLTSCFTYGSIAGKQYVGGLIGAANQHTVSNSGAVMEVTAQNGYAGGIMGSSDHMTKRTDGISRVIENSFAIGDITSNGAHAGGIIGYSYGYYVYTEYYSSSNKKYYYYSNSTVSNCYYSGNIQGKTNVGGIVGYGHQSRVDKSYAIGSVSGTQNVGGIIGYIPNYSNYDYTSKITSSVSIHSAINAITSDVGRIYGKMDGGEIGQTGSQTGNLGLGTSRVVLNGVLQTINDDAQNGTSTGRSTLKVRGTYQAIGWNFNDDWNILDTECHPYAKTQMAPPVIETGCYAGSTVVTGKSTNGGTVHLSTNGKTYTGTVSGYQWQIATAPLQGGAQVVVYADDETQVQSYLVTQDITYPGKGTEADPYRISTAADLAGANGNYYYKLMNDIDLTDYINENYPQTGWQPIGKGASVMAHFDGDGYTVTGLWINSTDDYVGLFSNASGAEIKNLNVSIASGKKVKGGNYTGGLIGRMYNGKIENCSVRGTVEGKNYTGGLVGSDDYSANVKNKVVATVTGAACVGGVAGNTSDGTMEKAMFEGTVSSSTASAYAGGIAGSCASALSKSLSKGTVAATGSGSMAGGIVGKNEASGSVADSYSTAAVTSQSYVGGVAAYNYGKIVSSFASGNLKSSVDFGGGVTGYNDGPSATTIRCVAINEKIEIADEKGWASRVVGGIKNGAPTPNMDNYAYKEMVISINGVPMKLYNDNLNGTAKTLVELKSQTTYEGIYWDFNATWSMDETTGLPYLLAEVADPVAAKSITLDKQTATIEIGKNINLTATVLPDDVTKKAVTWKSSNTAVATVADGKVTAIAAGTAQITATTTDGTNLSATCKVTVTTAIIPVSSVTLDKSTASVEAGKVLNLKATVLPDNATAKTLTWTTSNSKVATVENGTVTAVDAGMAVITATTTDGSELSAKCTVTVTPAKTVYPTTDVSVYDNALYVEDVETAAGASLTLPLMMKNAKENITAFECRLMLPDGVEWASTIDKRGNTVYTLPTFNEDRTDASYHTINAIKQMSDGSYYIIVYSDNKEYILDTDGAILNIPVTISEDMQPGEYNIFVNSIVMTDVNTQQTLLERTVSKLTIPAYTLGDANNDTMINITDVVAVISYMLEENPNPFVFQAADVNADNMINVTDVVGIIDIMTADEAPASSAALRHGTMNATGMNPGKSTLEIVPFTLASGTTTKNVSLDLVNPGDEFTAFECKVYLPEGFDWASTVDKRGNVVYTMPTFNEDRTDDSYHTINKIKKMSDGGYYVIVYSDAKEIFLEEEGTLLNLPLVFDENLADGVYDIRIGDIVLSRQDVTQELPDDYTASVIVGSPEVASMTLHGDFTSKAIADLNTALADNEAVCSIDFSEAYALADGVTVSTANKNLLIFVTEDASLANTSNVVAGSTCANLVLTDGYAFGPAKTFTATSGTYSHDMTDGEYGTVVLPFAPSTETMDAYTFYTFKAVGTNTLSFDEVASPVAGVPYLIVGKGAAKQMTAVAGSEVVINAGNTAVDGWTMTGTYTQRVFTDATELGNLYYISNNTFMQATKQLTMNPFRAYFVGDGSAKTIELRNSDGTTRILNMQNEENDGPVYDVAGRKVQNPDKGIYVVNGKKVLVR